MIYPGTDLKYRIETNIVDFDPLQDNFSVEIINGRGNTKKVIQKDDMVSDASGRWYFVVENVRKGYLFVRFNAEIQDEDYDKTVRIVTDYQLLCVVGRPFCRACHCKDREQHKVRYEQVWTASMGGTEYLCDKDGNYIVTSDDKRIVFTQKKEDIMPKVKLNMTGDEFKRLIEQRDENGEINTLPEVIDAMRGIKDSSSVKEETGNTYDGENRTLYINGAKPTPKEGEQEGQQGTEETTGE